LIEFGIRGDNFPSERITITSYIHQHIPELDRLNVSASVLSPTRTFFEKATLLHAEYNRPVDKPTPERLSRHFYDVYQLANRRGYLNAAMQEMDLLKTVIKNKETFFPSAWAKYDQIFQEGIHLLPGDRLKEIEEDYKKMEQMFFNAKAIPSMKEILLKLEEIETQLNKKLIKKP
jgi:hypothetical protein